MIRTSAGWLNGLGTGSRAGWTELDYRFPGRVDVEVGTGITLRSEGFQEIHLGKFREADNLTEAMIMDPSRWAWEKDTKSVTRAWAQHVLAAERLRPSRSRGYEHDGDLVVVGHWLPPRTVEELLWVAGFRPSLATWRARATDALRDVQVAAIHALNGGAIPKATRSRIQPEEKVAELAQHAWMRWFAVFRTELEVGGRTYKLNGRPLYRDDQLVLRFRHPSSGSELTIASEVATHPFLHNMEIDVAGEVLRRQSVAWEDLPNVVDEIGTMIAAQKMRRFSNRTRA